MITVVKSPEQVTGVKNAIEFELSTNNFRTSAGTKASQILQFDLHIPDDSFFHLYVKGRKITFTFKDEPDDSGVQLPNNFELGDTGTFVYEELIPALQRNFYLRDYDFNIIADLGLAVRFKIEAKQTGAANSIYSEIDIADCPNLFMDPPTPGTDATYQPNFKIYFDLFKETANYSGVFEPFKADLEGIPTTENKVLFDVSEYLKPLLNESVVNNLWSKHFVCPQSFVRFFARYTEVYGTPAEPKSYRETGKYIAINGGRKLVNVTTNYSNYFKTGEPSLFLTQMPNGVEVHKLQDQYLSVWFDAGGPFSINYNLFYDVKINYTDGTFSAHNVDDFIIYDKQIITLKAGYTQLGIAALATEGKTVASYELRLYNESEGRMVANYFKFSLPSNPKLNNRFFVFNNAFGMQEVMWFTGSQTRELQFDNDMVRHSRVAANATIVDGEFQEINNELRGMFKLTTGFKPKSYLQYFRDFLLSSNKYEQAGSQYQRVVMGKQKIKLDTDLDTNFSVEFTYNEAWIERGNA
jgi:hypothetical protein